MISDRRTIRDATEKDAAACAAIYAPYVTDTVISFELEPPTPAQMAMRIASAQEKHAWLLLEDGAQVVGYAYANAFNERAAYRWACAVSVYLEVGRRRTGAGRVLYEALFRRLAERGYRQLLAGITLPNEPSVGLHTALGFEPAAVYRQVGWKHEAWHDVAWMQRAVGSDVVPPREPR
jgi:phosphinothricin acetyltransferase